MVLYATLSCKKNDEQAVKIIWLRIIPVLVGNFFLFWSFGGWVAVFVGQWKKCCSFDGRVKKKCCSFGGWISVLVGADALRASASSRLRRALRRWRKASAKGMLWLLLTAVHMASGSKSPQFVGVENIRTCKSSGMYCSALRGKIAKGNDETHSEILGFIEDELLRKHLPRMFSLIKNES